MDLAGHQAQDTVVELCSEFIKDLFVDKFDVAFDYRSYKKALIAIDSLEDYFGITFTYFVRFELCSLGSASGLWSGFI